MALIEAGDALESYRFARQKCTCRSFCDYGGTSDPVHQYCPPNTGVIHNEII